MEVYIDSTHRTNVNKAELFGIIAEENGTGIPIGYMLMENKPTVDSEAFPGEVTSCCTRFFQYAFQNGLNPRMIHTDKSAAEINAIKAVWPGSEQKLCAWHVNKDINERFQSHKEKIHHRSTHAWSLFPHNPELAFIRVEWLHQHRQMRIDLVQKRLDAASAAGITVADDQRGMNEPTLLNTEHNSDIRGLMMQHLHWHPFKAGRKHQFPGDLVTSRAIWLWQAKQMHDKCCSLGEGYAWEYMWNNWYQWQHWTHWARSANLEYYPIIQTNAIVEAHWSVIKCRGLQWFSRPRMDHLCATIHEQLIPLFVILVNQVRLKLKPAGWYKLMVAEWRDHNKTIAAEDESDEMDEGASDDRLIRMEDIHRTDLGGWSCTCVRYMISPYHLCKHLVRQFGPQYPGKGEIIRQRTAPLMWIAQIHAYDPDLREIRVNPNQTGGGRSRQPTASLEDLGVTQEDLELLEASFPQQEVEGNDPRSTHALQIRQMDDLQDELEWLLEEFKTVSPCCIFD